MSLPPPTPGSVALVTGASSGLGVDLARSLARRGHAVVLAARRLDRLEELAAELERDHGIDTHAIACDLAHPDDRDALHAELVARGLAVEVLVNNAGLGAAGPFQDTDHDRLLTIARVNVEAVVDLCRRHVGAMVERRRGAILNVASTTAFQPLTGAATYAASKAFVLSFTEALSEDLHGTGVVASALCPGPVRTEIWDQSGAGDEAALAPEFMWTESDRVAEDGIVALETGRRAVVPGVFNRIGSIYGQHTPRSLLLPVTRLFRGR